MRISLWTHLGPLSISQPLYNSRRRRRYPARRRSQAPVQRHKHHVGEWIALFVLIALISEIPVVGHLLGGTILVVTVFGAMIGSATRRWRQTVGTPPARQVPAGPPQRQPIPQDVKIAVAQRDGGRCRRCGADRDLQFDHIIPVSKGGGNSVANVQILCGTCNRMKGDGY